MCSVTLGKPLDLLHFNFLLKNLRWFGVLINDHEGENALCQSKFNIQSWGFFRRLFLCAGAWT